MIDLLKRKRQDSRRRRRQRRLNLIVGLTALAVFLGVGISLWLASRPQTVRIAVDRADAGNYAAMQALASFAATNKRPVRFELAVTDNRSESLDLLRLDQVEMAVSRSDAMPSGSRAALIIRKDNLVIWTDRPKKGGDEAERLTHDSNVALLDTDPANKVLLLSALTSLADRPDAISIKVFPPEELEAALQDKSIGYFAAFAEPVVVKAAAHKGRSPLRFIAIDQADAIARRTGGYEAVEITTGSIISNPAVPAEETATLSVAQLLISKGTLSEQTGIAFAGQLFSDRPELLSELKGIASLEKLDTDKDAAIPVHHGVAAYLDGTERTFVERYSDLFWGVLLVLSGIGTAGAWVRTLYYRDESDAQLRFRSELLEKTEQVQQSASMQSLEKLDERARSMMRETLDAYEKGAIDEGALTAFEIVHADFRFALTNRLEHLRAQVR